LAGIDQQTTPEPQRGMGRFTTAAAFIAAVAAIVAAATIWLLVTDPVTMAVAIESGEVTPLVRQLADLLYEALKGLLGYL